MCFVNIFLLKHSPFYFASSTKHISFHPRLLYADTFLFTGSKPKKKKKNPEET